ncbi:MAG TPA: EAL domain-containing protein [Rhodanobacteraceae bacterium]|nr:EAL domain-containing protein [Rhodanobacteraceae bacterium]
MARRVLAGIRGSEERYRLLFDSAPDAIVMVDEASGRILDANLAAAAWTGRDPRELQGLEYANLFASAAQADDAEGGELRGPGGTLRAIETQTSVTRWGERPVRQAVIRDVTERRAAERERRIAAEALASIAEGVIIADADRRVLSMNAAATELTGFTAAELAGQRLGATRSLVDGGPLPASIWDEVVATHHWSGDVQSTRRDGSTYAERLGINMIRDADQKLLYYVAVFSDVSSANADRRRLEQLAAHDALTGLVNRSEFQRRCDVAIKRVAPDHGAVAVLFIDLDAFKFVNDSYSHAVGDRLLKLVARRITAQMREGDVAGRIGGDEFTVLLPGLDVREDAATPARRLLKALAEPFHIDDYEIVLSASIGIACYPLDGVDAATLIGNADAAMYSAKSEERNALRFYAPTMQVDTGRRMVLATELRQALAEGEFRLLYQPSVELKTGRTVGVEALIRWQHPQRGEVMPSEFIPIAESIGLIHLIDKWVMNAACAQISAWDAVGMPPIRVAVNVSARWFGHPGFIESVRHTLGRHGVGAERIVLEITEGAMLRLGETTESTMRALHALGIGVAIDDFGTGYASMAYLKLPAVSFLKIDGSFVSGLPENADDAAITSATLAMAGSLGLTTIAECIETEAQHEFLAHAGCVEGQGYLYSYPLPPSALEHMLRPHRHTRHVRLRLVPQRRG